jgi:23S rRNA (pseudouridine1915-N3)-methyltransferase
MKIKFFVIGRTNSNYLIEGEKDYEKRLSHYCKFKELVLPNIKNSAKLSTKELMIKEGELILSKLNNNDHVILLDEKGNQYSSTGFSNLIAKKIMARTKNLVFIVGGAFGFSHEVYKRADSEIGLSKMTFSHQMVRMIFKEQLYRAFTIIKVEKYHNE